MNQFANLSISEAASLLSISPKTLRRWENSGKINPARDDKNNRIYTDKDMQKLRHLCSLPPNNCMAITEAAEFLSVTPKTIRRWIKTRVVIPYIINRKYYFDKAQIENLQLSRELNPYFFSQTFSPSSENKSIGLATSLAVMLAFLSTSTVSMMLLRANHSFNIFEYDNQMPLPNNMAVINDLSSSLLKSDRLPILTPQNNTVKNSSINTGPLSNQKSINDSKHLYMMYKHKIYNKEHQIALSAPPLTVAPLISLQYANTSIPPTSSGKISSIMLTTNVAKTTTPQLLIKQHIELSPNTGSTTPTLTTQEPHALKVPSIGPAGELLMD